LNRLQVQIIKKCTSNPRFLLPLIGAVLGGEGLSSEQLAKSAGIKNGKMQKKFQEQLNKFLTTSKDKPYQLSKINKKTLDEYSKKLKEHHETQPSLQSTEVSDSEESDFQIKQPTSDEKEKEAIDTGLNKFFKFVKNKKSVAILTIISMLYFYYHFYQPHSLSLPYFS